MDTSVNAANQVVSVGADIAFDADPKFFACLVRFESSSVPTTLPTAYDVYPLDGRNRRRLDRKSGSAGMPRPISYAVFCLKKKINEMMCAFSFSTIIFVFYFFFLIFVFLFCFGYSLHLLSFPTRRSSDLLLVLILLLMPTLNFLPVWFALSLLRFRLPSRLPMMFILWMVGTEED